MARERLKLKQPKFDLGDNVRDIVTGTRGIVTGRFEGIGGTGGTVHYLVEQAGQLGSETWVHEQRLKYVEKKPDPPDASITKK